jgi:hypothetical protein
MVGEMRVRVPSLPSLELLAQRHLFLRAILTADERRHLHDA